MNRGAASFDWNHIRAFLATVETGSLSAAARALGQTQPTLSRQVSALEDALGLTLFERGTRVMMLTASGEQLLDHVKEMAEAATRISRVATGQSETVEGVVRITSSDAMAAYELPRITMDLRRDHPGIRIEIAPSSEVASLSRREADIAIRHVEPDQPDLIARRLPDIEVSLYASTEYLDQLGSVSAPADLNKASFIGFEQPERLIPQMAMIEIELTAENFGITATTGTAMFELARAGAGIALLPSEVAEGRLGLKKALPKLPSFPVPLWLVTHREIRTNKRIRLTFDHLAKALSKNRRSV
ncbi:LysR family transcriptional regulator [Erythrobacter sp. THAF29]|uniref:LysR family transcriptional regulator n=1 Tax=Erythrobacter sp. THAF29 TaxID=2587851 RepID=UPI001267BB51|nr:LysR family transcriptional regulator [Erythrobacter sp. THAF29]QFT78186.1 HTH-type transcriptional regulator BenM [Erythrobacter sp. THAF29]